MDETPYIISPKNDEIICSLPLHHEESIKLKKLAAKRLTVRFREGKEITSDQFHLEKYHAISEGKKHKEGYHLNTATSYWGLGLYTSVRLFAARGLAIAKSQSLTLKSNMTLSKVFGFLSLSYLIELLIDFGVLAKHVFFPNKEEQSLSWRQRLKNAYFKDNRPVRLPNAIIWFPLNLASFLLTGGLTYVVLNILGFLFDYGLELYRYHHEDKERTVLQQDLKKHLGNNPHEHTKEILNKLDHQIVKKKKDATRKIYIAIGILTMYCISAFPPAALFLLGGGMLLCGIGTPIHHELNTLKAFLIILGILACAAALAFPPVTAAVAGVASIVTITAACTFVIGSVFGGLGHRIWSKISHHTSCEKTPDAPPYEKLQPNLSPKSSSPVILQKLEEKGAPAEPCPTVYPQEPAPSVNQESPLHLAEDAQNNDMSPLICSLSLAQW